MGAPPEPTDSALADYVKARLQRIAPMFAEPQAVAEAIAVNRDLWLRLYEIDREIEATSDFANPS